MKRKQSTLGAFVSAPSKSSDDADAKIRKSDPVDEDAAKKRKSGILPFEYF